MEKARIKIEGLIKAFNALKNKTAILT